MNYFIAVELIVTFASVVSNACLLNDESWWDMQFNEISNPDVLDNISSGLKFMLWISENEHIEIKLYEELPVKNFLHKPLKMMIHGVSTTETRGRRIRMAYLTRLNEFNVITVDWSKYAYSITYGTAVQNAIRVGIVIGYLLKLLVDQEFVLASYIHLIGPSLGSHVAGSSGRSFAKLTETKIGRITGLDPPVIFLNICKYFKNQTFSSLDRDNANFVDVIYTTRGSVIGMKRDIGHANFLPNNGGPTQPKCKHIKNVIKRRYCSHEIVVPYYLESVNKSNCFESVLCKSYKEFKAGNCKNNLTSNMGHDADPTYTNY